MGRKLGILLDLRKHWTGPAAFGISFLVYVQTLCPSVYVEGSGELIGATHFLGTPHPTGYPLFCLVGRLFSAFLPFENVAYKVNIASAFTGALAVAALTAFLHWRGCQAWTALGTGLGFGFSGTFWSQVIIAEVYGLSTCAAVVVMWVGIRAVELRDERWLMLLAFLMGLGLTTHLSQVLIWPGLVLLLVWGWPGIWRCAGLLGKGVLSLAGGYSLVLYLLLRNGRGPGFHWGPLDSPAQLWGHLSGAIYRSSFLSIPLEGALLNAQRWGAQVVEEFHPLLVLLMGWGVWVAIRKDRSTVVVAGMAVVLNLAAAWNYHRDPNGLGVFFLLSILGLAVFLGYAMDDVGRRLARVLPGNSGPVLVGAAVCLSVLVGNYARSDRSQNWIPYTYGRDILQGLPPGAVLLTEGDDASFILDYLQRAEGMRPDVKLYSRIGRGTDLLEKGEHVLSLGQQNALRARREARLIRSGERPVFCLYPTRPPVTDHTFSPAGLCYRVWPIQGVPDSSGLEIDLDNARQTGMYRDPWVRKIQANYWYMLGEQQRTLGRDEQAVQSYQKAAEIAHDSRSMRFNIALIFYRSDKLDKALAHARAALGIDPFQAHSHRLMAHILRRQGQYQEAEELLKRAQVLKGIP